MIFENIKISFLEIESARRSEAFAQLRRSVDKMTDELQQEVKK